MRQLYERRIGSEGGMEMKEGDAGSGEWDLLSRLVVPGKGRRRLHADELLNGRVERSVRA